MTETEARFILGLGPSFSDDDLRRAYRKAAAENHPDRGGNAERMVLVNEAFDTLRSSARDHPAQPQPPDYGNDDVNVTSPSTTETLRPHPLDRWVVRITGALAVVGWGWRFVADTFKDASDLWGWVFFGIPILYLLLFFFVKLVFNIGIRVYNAALKLYKWAEGQTAQSPTSAPAAFQWSLTVMLLVAGLLAFYIGDGRGDYYNGGIVFVGWVCIGTAVALRKSRIGRTLVNAGFHSCAASAAFRRFARR